jgi:hypothetical protein
MSTMPHTAFECRASKMVNSDTCPRPTTFIRGELVGKMVTPRLLGITTRTRTLDGGSASGVDERARTNIKPSAQ